MSHKAAERTLLTSVLLSAPGPLVMGIGLFVGRSSTQLADFLRRTAELAAIIVSLIVFRMVHKTDRPDPVRRKKLEHIANMSVGVAMCLSGVGMVLVALLATNTEKGNVIPGLVIAVLGVITNAWFWRRYRKLDRERPDAILAVQSKLYRAKTLVDICVAGALLFIVFAPTSPFTVYVDLGGSFVVSGYLITNGIITIRTKANPANSLSSS